MRERLGALADRYPALRVALDLQKRVGEVHGGTIAASVTLSMFLSLFPALVVASAVLGFIASGRQDIAVDLVDALGLTGSAADSVVEAVESAENSRQAASIVGLAGLAWAALGVTTTVQLAVDTAWQVQVHSIRQRIVDALWLLGFGIGLALSVTVTGVAVALLPAWAAPFGIVLTAAGDVLLLWWTFHLLGSAKVGWRPLLPGAIFGGIGLALLTTIGSLIVPNTVASSSAVYGSIGVVFAILAWLFMLGRLLVYSSALNVVVFERKAGTATVVLKVPRLPGQVPVTANRSGVVDEVASLPGP